MFVLVVFFVLLVQVVDVLVFDGLCVLFGLLLLMFVLVRVECIDGIGYIVIVMMLVYVEGDVVCCVVGQFIILLCDSGGLVLQVQVGCGKEGVYFVFDKVFKIGVEGYQLCIGSIGVIVQVVIEVGLFYGVVILLQLVIMGVGGIVLVLCIDDVLCFSWCGLMFDLVCYFQSLDEIKCVFDVMVEQKFNIFYWYFIDDQGWCMEIKCYLKLIGVGSCCIFVGDGGCDLVIGVLCLYCGFYIQDQICEVIVYVVVCYIQVILEIDVFGYVIVVIVVYFELGMLDILFMLLSEWGVFLNLFNIEESMFWFLENVLEEVIVFFFVKYVYVGGDEVVKDQWKVLVWVQVCMCVFGVGDEMEMQSYLIKCLEKYLEQYDCCLIGWDEIFEGGLLLEVMVMLWCGIEGGLKVVGEGYDVIMLLVIDMYMDYLQIILDNELLGCLLIMLLVCVYGFELVFDVLVCDKQQYIFGLQVNMFIEYMCSYVCLQYNLFLWLVVVVEIGWLLCECCDYGDFFVCLLIQL